MIRIVQRSALCLSLLIVMPMAYASQAHAPIPAIVGDPAQLCQATARQALGQCTTGVGQAQIVCHMQTGTPCFDGDPGLTNPLDALAGDINNACTTASIQDAGLGDNKILPNFVAQLQESCTGNVATISARTYGGPHATLLPDSDATLDGCLFAAASESSLMLQDHLDLYGSCIESAQAGGMCDAAATEADVDASIALVESLIAPVCPGSLMADTIGIDVAEYVRRAAAQARCMVSLTHGDTVPFELDCGPITPPPAGVATQIVIDDLDVARCGDGSPYRFWVKMPPEGEPSNDVLVYLQGGGVCTLQGQCQAVADNNPGLFTSEDDAFPTQGILGESAANPFADYTRVFLPYCTQDVFIGGGATQVYSPSLTVERWGGRNVRAALDIVRNILWGDQRDAGTSGYEPDAQDVIFSGNSAGGFGALYNYHYLLDELRWRRAQGVPSASLALDNGQGTGILLIGALVQGLWDARSVQPSYCQSIECAVGPFLAAATSPRLDATFRQRLLWVSNQVDDVQASTTNFASPVDWTNAVRTSYCADSGLPGVHYFLSAEAASTHGVLSSDSAYLNLTASDVPLTAWLNSFVAYDAVSEGTLVDDVPGVNAFACTVDDADPDGDGIGNRSDNCTLTPNPAQRDTDGDGIGNRCDTDLDNDCVTNAIDLGIFKSRFFTADPDADFDGDGIVATIDLGLLKVYFFTTPGPSGLPNLCE